jgi:hypothetical protein
MDIKRLQELSGIKPSIQISEGLWDDLKNAMSKKDNEFSQLGKEALKLLGEVREELLPIAKFASHMYNAKGSPVQGYKDFKEDLEYFNQEIDKVFGFTVTIETNDTSKPKIKSTNKNKCAYAKLTKFFIHETKGILEAQVTETDEQPTREISVTPEMEKAINNVRKKYVEATKVLYKMETDLAKHFGKGKIKGISNTQDHAKLNKIATDLSELLNYFEDFAPFMVALSVPSYTGAK